MTYHEMGNTQNGKARMLLDEPIHLHIFWKGRTPGCTRDNLVHLESKK